MNIIIIMMKISIRIMFLIGFNLVDLKGQYKTVRTRYYQN